MKLIGQTFSDENMTAFANQQKRAKELERLYAERDRAFGEVQRAKEALGNAENKLHSIKREIADLHRANGQRG